MEERIAALLAQMTVEEKVSLTIGRDMWSTNAVERLGIPSISLCDGPHGVRKPRSGTESGIGDSLPATCFPTASAIASSWDLGLVHEIGQALGVEAQALDVQILLGPGLNIKRTPLGGRNFEYFSEDPVLSGDMAAALIEGIQSQGVGTSIKHYACNNQEFERMTMDVSVDTRALREIYLTGFERAITMAHPWTVMAAYNKVNGTYASEHEELLRRILKEEWGFAGAVLSDWGAVNDKDQALLAGLDLEMPGGRSQPDIVAKVMDGSIPVTVLDEAVTRVLRVVLRAADQRQSGATFDVHHHHALATRAAAESMVLLKNDGGLLPLTPDSLRKVAIIGRFAEFPRFQGAGSSQIVPTQVDTPLTALTAMLGPQIEVTYIPGYDEASQLDADALQQAAQAAAQADVAIIFAGLPDAYESEGFDRKHIDMPPAHNRLIEAVCHAQPKTIVVLQNGSAVAMPWIHGPAAVLETWLGGQASGQAVADVLLGVTNPSGRLSETFPVRLTDTPAFLNYPGENGVVRYGEGLYVGYRYYEKKDVKPLFPFGYGLSYTEFDYLFFKLGQPSITEEDTLEVLVTVRNTGARQGKEVVQLYVRQVDAPLQRPVKELKAFAKIDLAPGEQTVVRFALIARDFACYDPSLQAWRVDSGEYQILVGPSSDAIRLRASVTMEASLRESRPFHKMSLVKHLVQNPIAFQFVKPLLPPWLVLPDDGVPTDFMSAMTLDLPLKKVVGFSQGAVTEEMLDMLLAHINQAVLDAKDN